MSVKKRGNQMFTNCDLNQEFMLDKEVTLTLERVLKDARGKRHEIITVQHLMLALLDNSVVSSVLTDLDADLDKMRTKLILFIDKKTPLIPLSNGSIQPQPTKMFQLVFEHAAFCVSARGREEISEKDILLAIFCLKAWKTIYTPTVENIFFDTSTFDFYTRCSDENEISKDINDAQFSENPTDLDDSRVKLDPFSSILYSTKADKFSKVENYQESGLSLDEPIEKVAQEDICN